MRRMTSAALALLAACSVQQEPSTVSARSADPHDIAVDALWEGQAAIAERDADSIERVLALLDASGAASADGEDIALAWRKEGEDIAGRPFARPPPLRGRALGAAYRAAVIEPGRDLVLEQIFLAGKKAKVSVVPSGLADIRFSIAEQDGNAVCSRDVGGSPATCTWLPVWTTRYRIEVRNEGRSAASIHVVIS